MNNIRIKCVKTQGDKILIEHQTPPKTGAGKYDDLSLKCAQPAKPAFYDSLAALAPFVIEICELPRDYVRQLEVTGVTFGYGGEDEVMGATITAKKTLGMSNAPFIIHTPYKPSEPLSEGGSTSQCLSQEAIEALEQVQQQACDYLAGDRAQMGLDFEDDTDGYPDENSDPFDDGFSDPPRVEPIDPDQLFIPTDDTEEEPAPEPEHEPAKPKRSRAKKKDAETA